MQSEADSRGRANGQRSAASAGALDFSMVLAAHLHEIKNDLFFLLGALGKLATQNPDPLATTAQLSGAALSNKLVRLLALYRLSLGCQPVQRDLFAVREILEDMQAELGSIATARGIHLTVEADYELHHVFDRELLACALINAVHNALKAAKTSVRIVASKDDLGLLVQVIDDGAGPAEPLGDHAIDPRSGLGLYFCQQIAEAHLAHGRKGSVRLEEAPGGGARWTLNLP